MQEYLITSSSPSASPDLHAIAALQEHPELLPLIQRKFRSAGDVDTAQRLVFDSRGLQRARELAAQHASLAVRAVRLLRPAHGICFP